MRIYRDVLDWLLLKWDYLNASLLSNQLRSTEDKNHIIAINPEILEEKGEFDGFLERCMSIPGYKGFVNRQLQVKIKYQDISGGSHFIEAEGFLARIFLH